MPHELTLNLRELYGLPVELRDDFGRPLFFKQPKLLCNGNGPHGRQGNPRRDGEGAVPWSRAIQMHIPERMIRRMAKLLGGSLAGQLVAFGAAFVLARIYGPEAYAHLEMFALVTGIGAVLGTGKFEQALMLPKSEKDALGLLWAGQRFVWATVFLVAVVGIGSAHWVADTWSLPSWHWIAWSLPVFTGLAAHARLLEYWHHRQSQVGHVAVAKASGPFLSELTKWGSAGWFPLMGLSLGSGAGIAMRWAIMRRGLNSVCQAASPWGAQPFTRSHSGVPRLSHVGAVGQYHESVGSMVACVAHRCDPWTAHVGMDGHGAPHGHVAPFLVGHIGGASVV